MTLKTTEEQLLEKAGCVIVLKGEESRKKINGEEQKVFPFIGVHEMVAPGRICFGIIFAGKEVYGSSFFRNNLIGTWRAMKIFESLKEIDENTVHNCLPAGMRNISSQDPVIFNLAEKFNSLTDFQIIRSKILNSAPGSEEIEKMLKLLTAEKIEINAVELEEEINLGQIKTSPLIEKLLEEDRKREEQWEKTLAEIERPVTAEESISTFFTGLGFNYFLASISPGIIALVSVADLDLLIKRNSLIKCFGGKYILKRVIGQPGDRNFGKTEEPYFISSDGSVCHFISARHDKGVFLIIAKIEKKGYKKVEGEYTISELRDFFQDPDKQKRIEFIKKTTWQKLRDFW